MYQNPCSSESTRRVTLVSSWQQDMNGAFAAFLDSVCRMVQKENISLRPVVITYVADSPPASIPEDTPMDLSTLWQSPVHTQLHVLLQKSGFASITHSILSTQQPINEQTESFKQQLEALDDPQVLVLCTPTYAGLAESEGGVLGHMLSAFGEGKQDSLLPLICAGDFSHAARIVPTHFLFRNWQPALAEFNGHTGGMPALIDLFSALSGKQGLGLLPDLLDLSDDRNASYVPQYVTHLDDLERIQARLTTDEILYQDLDRQSTQHALYPQLEHLPVPVVHPGCLSEHPNAPRNLNGLIDHVLDSPTIKTALCLGASSVDTELAGLNLIEQLRRHPKNPRVMTINLAQYPRQAAQQCVALHLDHVLQIASPIIQDMKQQRLDDPKHTRPTVWVLTNYQHIGTYLNIYVSNALSSWKNAKVLVTCTAQYFDRHDAKTCFLSDPTNPDLSSFMAYPLSPFASHIPDASMPQPLSNLDALLSAYSPRRRAQQTELDQFLKQIQSLSQGLGKAFISYAWERGAALMRQQGHLRQLAHDLGKAGLTTWLDVERMTGDMNTQMQQNIENSRYAIIIGTPRYTQRSMEATNVKREYDAIIRRYDAEQMSIIPLCYLPEGTVDQSDRAYPSFPMAFPKELPVWNIQDVDAFDCYMDHLTDSARGILPRMLGLNQSHPGFALYQQSLDGLHQSLALLPAQHLILNQAEQDQMVYEIPTRRALYIEARGKGMPEDAETFSLTQSFDAFLDEGLSACTTFVALGSGGSGKSLFAQIQYARLFEQWREHRLNPQEHTRPDWIPVYIPLKHYVEGDQVQTCVETALRAVYHCHDMDINHLKTGSGSNLGVLLILDGFDELGGQTPNLYQVNGLHAWQCPVKLLITSRMDYVPNPESHHYYFGSQGENSFKRAYIQPFSQADIQTYIGLYQADQLIEDALAQAKRDQDAGILAPAGNPNMDTYERLASLPGLLELLCNPFLLNLVLQGLPYLLAKREQSELSHQVVTRLDIYDAFTQYWFGKEVYRRVQQDDPALRCYFESQAEGLAFALYLKKALSVSEAHDPSLWKQYFHDSNNPKVAQAMAALPLRGTGDGRYEFMHKTLWEYFTCRYVVSAYQRPVEGQPHPNPEALMHALAARPLGAQAEMAAGISLPRQEQGVYSFFHDALNAQTSVNSLKTAFLEQITRSVNQDGPRALASAHAATLLVKSGISLANQSWSGVQLPGADLKDAQLWYTDLQGAQLQGAYLGQAFLWGADLRQAHLMGVRFGELPSLKMDDPINAFALHPKKSWVAVTAGNDIVVKHAETQELLHTLKGHTGTVMGIAFSPNGDKMVSGSDDHTLRLWKIENDSIMALGAPLVGHTQLVRTVAFSPNGNILVSGSDDTTLRLWKVNQGGAAPVGTPLIGHTHSVNSVAFSPNGNQVVSGSYDQTLRLWQIESFGGRPLGEPLTGHVSWVTSVAFSPSGNKIVSGSGDHTLRLWQIGIDGGKPFGRSLMGHTHSVTSVAFSSNGDKIVSGSFDKTLRLWEMETDGAKPLGVPCTGHTGWVTAVAFHHRGDRVISGSYDKTIRLWQVGSSTESLDGPLTGHLDWVKSVALNGSGDRVVSGSQDNTLRLWQMEVDRIRPISKPFTGHTNWVSSVAFSANKNRVVSGSRDNTLRLWQIEEDDVRPLGEPLTGHMMQVNSVAFSPAGDKIVSGSDDQALRLWQIGSNGASPLGNLLTGHTVWVSSVAFNPSGDRIVSGSHDHTLRLWQIDSDGASPLGAALTGHTRPVLGVAFNFSGDRIVSGSQDQTLRLWQVDESGASPLAEPLMGHTREVKAVAFSPNGNRVVSGSGDQTLRVWDITDVHHVVCTQIVHWAESIQSIAFPSVQPKTSLVPLVVGSHGGVSLWSFQEEPGSQQSEGLRFVDMPPQPNWGMLWRRMWSQVTLAGARLSSIAARLIAEYREESLASLPLTVVDDTDPLASDGLVSSMEIEDINLNLETPEQDEIHVKSEAPCCTCI